MENNILLDNGLVYLHTLVYVYVYGGVVAEAAAATEILFLVSVMMAAHYID